ncbi:MAG: hypothetical protein CSA38_04625 [Flavobacteriales bacterium]|nr:MAG: hypothetical protein CSA38_04625 [Flavobacteriales bacterium]
MNIKSKKYVAVALVTFVILFLMNYLGNEQEDRLYRASLTALMGVVGLTVGLWFVNKAKENDTPPEDFD